MVPILAPAATRRIRKRLLFHNSLKLSISDSAVRSSIETPLNFASTIPANHPAARRGCMEVMGATIKATIAEGNLDPANSDPKNAMLPVRRTNHISPPWISTPFKSAAANIKINMAGMANKTILVMFILFSQFRKLLKRR